MIEIHVLPLGDYQTNCYLIREEGSDTCCILDPGFTPEIVMAFLREHSMTPEAILLTHGHFDHVGGVRELVAEYGCPVYLCTEDCAMPPMLTAGPLYYTHAYREGDTLHLAGLTLQVLQTPGHTPGSVCLLCQDALFSGDTLFAGSCGRTDLPGGSAPQIRRSLARLAALPGDFRVFPGHGPATTLSEERQCNPFL